MKKWPIIGLLAVVVALVGSVSAGATTRDTGRTCSTISGSNPPGVNGTRCYTGRVTYFSASSSRWMIDYYSSLYEVSAGASYGPYNDESTDLVNGYQSGTKTWVSPDSGPSNYWFARTGYPTTYGYQGQSRFKIDAHPDIPNYGDPTLTVYTSYW